ncbi:Chromo domain-containing protein [Cephalotus follicularis]|uniref:Chromo domain-containing protein n=1 Tax=Cephalotus follicularis TaxID=3775 RepID=A0A1Q3BKM9_CEPFO|nr:Chromo domain-containing protein [Cephalotus follicularis]
MVKLQPYRQQTAASRHSNKLSPKFYVPCRVEEKIGAVAYHLQLPSTSKIHPVFHISKLKPFMGSLPLDYIALPTTISLDKPLISRLAIVGRRTILRQGKWIDQILVQWQDTPLEDATWDDTQEFRKLYPTTDLEDKVLLQEERNDALPISIGPGLLKGDSREQTLLSRPKWETRIPMKLMDYVA